MAFCHRRRGDGFPFQVPGLGTLRVSGRASGAKQLYSATPQQYTHLEHSPAEPILGPGSLLLIAGEEHIRKRKQLAPAFQGENMRAFGVQIAEQTLRHLKSAGDTFIVQELARGIALDVIITCVLGVRESKRRERFHRALYQMMNNYTTPLMLFPFLRVGFFGLSPWDRFRASRALVHQLFRAEFEDDGQGRIDILGRLLAMEPRPPEDVLLSILATLLVAGHDTSAIGITWSLYLLHQHPRVLQRLRDDLRGLGTAPDQLSKSDYLKAVCREVLRLFPAVPASIRKLSVPLNFCGRDCPAGSNIAVSLTVLHSDPEVFHEPHLFRPERFLDRNYSPFEYAPFGGGFKRCIGESFALYEMSIVLGTILTQSDFQLLSKSHIRAIIKGIAMAPSRPIYFSRKS